MPKTRTIWSVALLVLLASSMALMQAPAQSWKQIIVKCSPQDLQRVQASVGAAIVDSVSGHYLINVQSSVDVTKVEAVKGTGTISASDNSIHTIPRRPARTSTATASSLPSLGNSVTWYGTPARQGYVSQAAVAKIQLTDALKVATGRNVRVAIIDTGVDESHPTLSPVLLPGKNYVDSSPGASEWNDPVLTQSTAAILDQSTSVVVLTQSTAAILDQSTAAILDQLPAFGHGTMMSGLIHLVAPEARIIPLKVFDATGSATEWNIIRAIYDAVNLGADVINMSFSASKKSKLVEAAIDYAASQGVVPVAASGNDDSENSTYPASFNNSVGISSLDQNDQKASFSNYGKYVDLSAPGVDLITTYPGGRFSVGSGTSDSVALVSGVFALGRQRGQTGSSLRQKVEGGADRLQVQSQYRNKLGNGRVNALKAVN